MKRVLAAFAVMAAVAVMPVRPAVALAPSAVGWWWKAAGVPRPPTVPKGGFFVAADPTGPTAVAALRFAMPAGRAAPVLTIAVAPGGGSDVGGASAAISAYAIESAWTPVEAGDIAAKPVENALVAVKGARSADGRQWTFDLTPLYDDGDLDVLIKPDAGGNFAIAFDPPSDAALRTVARPGSVSESVSEPDSAAADAPLTPFVDSGVPLDLGYPPPIDEIALNVGNQEPAGTALPGRGAPLVAPPSTRREAAGLGLLLFAAAVGAAYALSRIAPPPVRALGSMATPAALIAASRSWRRADAEVGGLGRFARSRTGPPPRL